MREPLRLRRSSPARTSPIGVHAGLLTPDWTPASARRTIATAAAIGFDLVEIPAPGADDGSASAAETAALLDEHRIDAVVSLALDASSDIHTADPAVSARGEARLADAVRFAAGIGAGYVGGVTHSAMRKNPHGGGPAERANVVRVLRDVAARAAADGIVLGLEYVNRYESNLLNTAAQTVALIEEVGATGLVVHLDAFHAHMEEVDLASAVRDAGDLLAYVHASENHRGALGTGSTDWDGLFAAFHAASFAGPLTVETFSPAVQSAAVADDIGLWRELWSDPVAVATAGHRFLADRLDAVPPAPAAAHAATGA
jgi:D-psicose/D-tagatose/L-ribulose 3-epimerase